MTKKSSNLRKVAKIGVACLAVCVMFSACGNESSDKKITAFSFASPQATGVIDDKAKTVIVEVPSGTNVTALVPTVTVSKNATVNPASGEAQDFTNPVTYTVTAENGSTAEYTVTVKVGSGGGNDGLFKDAKFKLPTNVSIKYESSMDGTLSLSALFVKIGNDFYREKRSNGEIIQATYLKYNGTAWEDWETVPPYVAWNKSNTFNLTQVIDKIGGQGDNLLNFMTAETRYLAIKDKTKSGTEAVAGVMCNKYVISAERTLYHDPVSNLFLKDVNSTTIYVVTEWDTTVTSFENINLPK